MPPISDARESRLRFLDLDPLLAELRRGGSAFLPEAVRVLRTETYGFLDEPFIESVHFARFGCPLRYDDGVSNFGGNFSRATVNFEVDPAKPECALPAPEDALTFLNVDQRCARLILPTEVVAGLDFEPRCMVLVLATDSERQLWNEMSAQGRLLSEPFRIEVNFTVATGAAPEPKLAVTNCQNARVLARNYALDRTDQDKVDALEDARRRIQIYEELIALTKDVRDSQALVSIDPATGKATLLPDPPPPPPPPPPAPAGNDEGSPAPPAPPALESLDTQIAIFERERAALEEEASALARELADCTAGSRAEV